MIGLHFSETDHGQSCYRDTRFSPRRNFNLARYGGVTFFAGVHQTDGDPGGDAGTVWVQKAILRINNAQLARAFSDFPVDLWDGVITFGESRLDNEIPIPLQHEGIVELRLEAWRPAHEVITLIGKSAELELIGAPEYVEEFRP